MRVVVCAEVQWRYVRTRKQQLLRRFPPGWRILFLQPYVRGRRNAWWPRRDGAVTFATVPVLKNVPQPRLRRWLERSALRRMIDAGLRVWVWCLRRMLGFAGRDTLLYVSNIYYGRVLQHLERRAAVYDCNDNHLAFPGTPDWARPYFEAVVRGVDAVVVSQALLRDEIEPLEPRQLVEIGNGVDFELFDRAWRAPVLPAPIAALSAPRLGYAGALAEWIDFDLFAHLAGAFPAASLMLVGPVVGSAAPLHALRAAHPNVHWLGAVPHEELPQWIAAMDVCLIPFRTTALTRGVNPNKLWEYFALGKPVVSTDFSPWVHDFAPLLQVAPTPDAAVEAVEATLAAPGDAAARRKAAQAHGWDGAAAAMTALFARLAAVPPGRL